MQHHPIFPTSIMRSKSTHISALFMLLWMNDMHINNIINSSIHVITTVVGVSRAIRSSYPIIIIDIISATIHANHIIISTNHIIISVNHSISPPTSPPGLYQWHQNSHTKTITSVLHDHFLFPLLIIIIIICIPDDTIDTGISSSRSSSSMRHITSRNDLSYSIIN